MNTESRIKVAIVDDHTLFREGLVSLLQKEKDLQIVGEAVTGAEMLTVVEQTGPDVLLLDLFMPSLGGLDILSQIHERHPSTKVLVLSAVPDQEVIFQALSEGVKGYIRKSASSADLVKAIRAVHAGEAWLERGVMGHLLERLPGQQDPDKRDGHRSRLLSRREIEVAKHVAAGLTNKEVAERLCISEKTAKSHVASIFRKLQFRHRLQLAIYTRERDLFFTQSAKNA